MIFASFSNKKWGGGEADEEDGDCEGGEGSGSSGDNKWGGDGCCWEGGGERDGGEKGGGGDDKRSREGKVGSLCK